MKKVFAIITKLFSSMFSCMQENNAIKLRFILIIDLLKAVYLHHTIQLSFLQKLARWKLARTMFLLCHQKGWNFSIVKSISVIEKPEDILLLSKGCIYFSSKRVYYISFINHERKRNTPLIMCKIYLRNFSSWYKNIFLRYLSKKPYKY